MTRNLGLGTGIGNMGTPGTRGYMGAKGTRNIGTIGTNRTMGQGPGKIEVVNVKD